MRKPQLRGHIGCMMSVPAGCAILATQCVNSNGVLSEVHMFRLLKLVFWGGVIYLFYQFFTRTAEFARQRRAEAGEPEAVEQGSEGGSRQLRRALNEDAGRAPLTGPGRGETVTTEDASGESVPHIVGRGVTHEG
jgi:hypothetical protein